MGFGGEGFPFYKSQKKPPHKKMIFFPSSKHPRNPFNPLGGFRGYGGLVSQLWDFNKKRYPSYIYGFKAGLSIRVNEINLTSF
jgi:hypothetical protein